MRRALILFGSGLLLTPVAGFLGSALVFSFLGTLLPVTPFTTELLIIALVVGGIFGSMLAAPVTLVALPLAGWLAPGRNWRHLSIVLVVGIGAGFASPAVFYPTMDEDGTRPVGLWLLGSLCGLAVAIPFYFLTARRVEAEDANVPRA